MFELNRNLIDFASNYHSQVNVRISSFKYDENNLPSTTQFKFTIIDIYIIDVLQ